jgi:hypothetical protein
VQVTRYAFRVDANQTRIISALKASGAMVKVIGKPVDLLVSDGRDFALFEVKDGDKVESAQKLTKAQIEFFKEFGGCSLFKVSNSDQAVEIFNTWRNR